MSYGPEAQRRTKRLLEALLVFTNSELENSTHLKIEFKWQEDSSYLVVSTKVRFLEELTAKDHPNAKLDKGEIKHALWMLKNFLHILEDNRTKTKGSEDWHFTLKLWSRDKKTNLTQFDLEWERCRLEKHNVNRPIPSAIPNQFKSLIADKTESFVGREYIFTAIADFLSSHPNGYFTIVGEPGIGKTAILSKYVEMTNCVVYFNARSQGINRTGQFLESICKQLITRYKLPYSSLPPEATQDGNFLRQILAEASMKLEQGEQLVIAIDALDEVDLTSQGAGANILYLPGSLPSRVYFIMTRRPIITLPLVVHTPQYVLNLIQYYNESLQDVRIYIQNATKRSQLHTWIKAQSLTVENFITTLAKKSKNNFMYLRYVLPDIERGVYQDLSIESLPIGLQGYYEDHWWRMGMTAKPLPRTKIKIVYILAELRQPISRRLISESAKEEVLVVQEVLDEWKQFLHEQNIDNQICYSLYHTSFNDFLHRKDIVQAAGVTIKDINTQIANHLWEELYVSE